MTTPSSLFKGRLINLKPIDLEQMAKTYVGWHRDTEYTRLADDEPANLYSPGQDEAWLKENWDGMIMFGIHTVDDDRLVGSIELMDFHRASGDAEVGIGIGNRADWGKGFGTEAIKMILRYAFEELNLHRVSLSVFEYNVRGFRSYQKAGFQEEGRLREFVTREGRKWDLILMGVLRSEWEESWKKEGLKNDR